MAFETAAGATLAASAALPATYDAAGYAALTFTDVGEVENLGAFGRNYNLVSFLPLAERGASKQKGSFNNGQFNPRLALDADDTGQGILETALDSDNAVALRVTLSSGRIYYMSVLVMQWQPTIGTVDDIVMVESNFEVTRDDVVRVDP
ncbi:MAG: hypothetical protein AAFR68_04075 [Pseudomonadota bacterium]